MIHQLTLGLERDMRIAGKYCGVEDSRFYGKAVGEDNLGDKRRLC
jgi:hypothetical protein